MSINSVSSVSNYSGSGQLQISEATKRKLIALGIDPTSVTSEAQAQSLILAAQQKQQIQQTAQNDKGNNNPSETELISKAKTLADKMGISVSNNESLTDILSSISSKISTLSAQTNGDNSKIKELQDFQAELSEIQNEFSTVQQNQDSMYNAMNYSANMNKLALGLN